MKSLSTDFRLLATADGIPEPRGKDWLRIGRRMLKRSWLDKATIRLPRFFCQNSGACGSSYIVQLLADNGVERCFHEPEPDFNQLGLDHYESPLSRSRLVRLFRYTRHDVFFEANNRLFSFSREIKAAFPNAKFIHLHRHPADAVTSAMSKPNVESYLRDNIRLQGSLAGDKALPPFERFCHYWNHMNGRILTDLSGEDYLDLKFADLIAGNLGSLESLLDRSLSTTKREVVNQGRVRAEGRFPKFKDWSSSQRETLLRICGPLMERLGYA